MTEGTDSRTSFLPLGDAATRLGLSRLKLREAIAKQLIPARRDNEGRWRVDIDLVPTDLSAAVKATAAAPEALMGALFDEIEELSADLDGSAALTGRLADLVERQAAALDSATDALESRTEERDRLATVADRALDAADTAETRATALQATTDRALALLDRTTAALERSEAETARLRADASAQGTAIATHAGQLDRLFALSEQALEAAGRARRAPGLIARMLGSRT